MRRVNLPTVLGFVLLGTLVVVAAPPSAAVDCSPDIPDQADSEACLQGSSVPTIGLLYPISSDLFVSSTGRIGIGTTSPAYDTDVHGRAHFRGILSQSIGASQPDPLAPPNLVTPLSIALGTAGDYDDSTGGNIYHLSSWVQNEGERPVVAVFGEGVATGSESQSWGGNFVGYTEADGATAIGTEVNFGSLSEGGTAHGVVIVSYGGYAGTQNYVQMQSGTEPSIPTDGIVFNGGSTYPPVEHSLIRSLYIDASDVETGIDFSTTEFSHAAIRLAESAAGAGVIGIGIDPEGPLHIADNGNAWSSSNYGTNMLLEGHPAADPHHPTIGVFDVDNENPWAITNRDGYFEIASMPALGNTATAPTPRVSVKPDGSVGIGTTSPSYLLHVAGTAGKPGGGTWADTSDGRLKQGIEQVSGREALDLLLQLRGVSYEWRNPDLHGSGRQIGVLAQDVEDTFPHWVSEVPVTGADADLVSSDGGAKALSFPNEFNALLIEALREQQAEIDELRRQLALLEAR